MRALRIMILVTVVVGLFTTFTHAANQAAVTFPVQRVLPVFGTNVGIFPEEEQARQFSYENARLYGVGLLPNDDPYGGAWTTVVTKIMRPPMVAQVWGEPGRRVTRLAGYVDGKWSDLNAQVVREGVAVALTEGATVPYQTEAADARRREIGRYAFRHVAWFWANSRPMYAITAIPASGTKVPVAIAMVGMTRIEAGYFFNGRVVLLPTGMLRLGSSVVDVSSRGPDLTFVMKSLGGVRTQILRWHWDGKAYQLTEATER